MELVRIFGAVSQRVKCESGSLASRGAYLILCHDVPHVQIWIGKECHQIDRAIAENLATKILQIEYKQSLSSTRIPTTVEGEASYDVSDSSSSTSPLCPLLSNLSLDSSPALDRSLPIHNDDIFFTVIDIDLHNGTLLSSHTTHHIITHAAMKLTVPKFSSSKIYLSECGTEERYLWIGHHIPRQFHHKITETLQQVSYDPKCHNNILCGTLSPLILIKDGFETILFLEKFHNLHEIFSNSLLRSSLDPTLPSDKTAHTKKADLRRGFQDGLARIWDTLNGGAGIRSRLPKWTQDGVFE
jgi:hypothetical protein